MSKPTYSIVPLILVIISSGCSGSPPPEDTTPSPPAASLDVPVAPEREGAPSARDLSPARSLRRVTSVERVSFGGAHPGFAQWISSSGRIAILRRFLHDNDGDGQVSPTFGHHGEPLGDQPTLALFDLSSDTSEVYDEIIATDPRGRFVVLRKDQHLWLVDAEEGGRVDLTAGGADPRGDLNTCLPPRQATFDPQGRSMTFLRTRPEGYVLTSLLDQREVIAESTSRSLLWRAEPQAMRGWVLLYEIPSDTDGDGQITFPQQRTSCACRWCNRFAMSMGFYGWDGDEFRMTLVDPSGGRIPVEGHSIALARGAYALLQEGDYELRQSTGAAILLPEDCEPPIVIDGASSVLLSCDDGSRLFWPADPPAGERVLFLAEQIGTNDNVIGSSNAEEELWIPITAEQNDENLRIGRLRMDDGQIEIGPIVTSLPSVTELGWSVARTPEGVVAIDVARGELYSIALSEEVDLRRSSIVLSGPRYIVMAPASSHWFSTSFDASLRTQNGCVLVPTTERSGLETGPWRLLCATP